jgi:hypothetical protein
MYPRIPDRQLTDDHLFASPYDPDPEPPKVCEPYAERWLISEYGDFTKIEEEDFWLYRRRVILEFAACPEGFFHLLSNEYPEDWQWEEAMQTIFDFLQNF